MSSHYAILCLTHDPAIVVGWDENWSTPQPALDAIADRADGPAQAHPGCDLLIGRYSYPLVEVCCPRSRTSGHSGYHPHSDDWIDAGWLRLLALSTPEQRKIVQRTGCWPYDTAWRLRRELCLEEDTTGG